MKIITGITKWRVADADGVMNDKVFGTQADAEAYGGQKVIQGVTPETTIYAAVSKMILPPVEAIKVDA